LLFANDIVCSVLDAKKNRSLPPPLIMTIITIIIIIMIIIISGMGCRCLSSHYL